MHIIDYIMPFSLVVFFTSIVWIFYPSFFDSVNATILQTMVNIQHGDSDNYKPVKYKDRPKKPRLITAEELASKNGTDSNKTIWLSIMSEVFDVSTGPQYYAPGAGYSVFAGRDANVPFITGNFTQGEAEKSITALTGFQLMNVEIFLNDTYRFGDNNYTFVGYLIGELYDANGNPTEILHNITKQIDEAKIERAKQEERRQQIIAERRRKDAEKRKANGGMDPPKPKVQVVPRGTTVTANTLASDTKTSTTQQKQQQPPVDGTIDEIAKEL